MCGGNTLVADNLPCLTKRVLPLNMARTGVFHNVWSFLVTPFSLLLQLLCDSVQRALFEEEERSKTLSQKVRFLEKANAHLREKVKNLKRALRQSTVDSKKEVLSKDLIDKEKAISEEDPKPESHKKVIAKPAKKATGNKLD